MSFYHVARGFTRAIFKILFWPKVTGRENEPAEGPFLVCGNHLSNADVILIGHAFKNQVRYFAKKELFAFPIMKQLMYALGSFPVDRENAMASVTSIKTTIKLLSDNQVVGMFPQGRRIPGVDPRKTSVKNGVGMIEYHAKVPIVPVMVQTRKWKVIPFRRTYIRIGKPIAYEEFNFTNGGSAEFSSAANLIFSRITDLIEDKK